MTDCRIEAGTLYANADERVVSGLLVPYGEVGRTNLGRFTIPPGVLSIPEDPAQVTLYDTHDHEAPAGRATLLADTPAGVVGTFRINNTPEGDTLLARIDKGERKSLSVEAKGLVIRAGKAVAGRIFGAAAVEAGAFPSATLYAEDAGELPEDDDTDPAGNAGDDDDAGAAGGEAGNGDMSRDMSRDADEDNTNPDAGDAGDDDEDEDTPMGNTLQAGAQRPGANQRHNGGDSSPKRPAYKCEDAASLYAAMATDPAKAVADTTLLAALDQATPADIGPAQEPTWLGEVWKSRTYSSRYADLLAPGTLTALKAVGWVFESTPTVGDWNGLGGTPAQITSTEVKTKAVTVEGKRLAGGGAFDRGFIDLPTPGFFEGYYREATNDVERKLDGKIIAHLTAAAGHTAVEAGTVPSGVATAAAYIVDGALNVIDAEIGLPSYAIVGTDLYRDLLLTRADDLLAFLNAALGFEGGELEGFKIRPSSAPALAGAVVVGAKDGTTLYRQPGTPIRVETVNVANGSGEGAVFAYHALLTNNAKATALVKPAPAPAG